jgi:phospho-N-acetylmuramoyl-pentapeptide-transferase
LLFYFFLGQVKEFSFFNLFRYLTVRTLGATLTALMLSLFMGPSLIQWLKCKQVQGQPIRLDGPQGHLLTKKGTPTMGGVLIIGALTISTLLWSDWSNSYVWIVLMVTVGFGFLGALDDYKKLVRQSSKGISAKTKLLTQAVVVIFLTYWVDSYVPNRLYHVVTFPFFKDVVIDVGWFFYIWTFLVIVGASNAVNLTDGLDGLAIGPTLITSVVFCVITYIVGNVIFSNYLQIPYIPNVAEVCVFIGALIGAGLGFLWFNAPPARVFMGDTGSLAVGGALGAIGVITKHEFVLALVGGLFVMEALSVIIQVLYFKKTKKRIFLMAPIHHHFEKKGWAEPTIVIRFWIISAVLAIIGLASLKIR